MNKYIIELLIKLYFMVVCGLGIIYNITELVKVIKEQKNK
jgi:hypothetical protein